MWELEQKSNFYKQRAVVTSTQKYESCPAVTRVKPNLILQGFAKKNEYDRMGKDIECLAKESGKGDNEIEELMNGSDGVDCGRKGKRSNRRTNKIK
jgi:hypothetical protein